MSPWMKRTRKPGSSRSKKPKLYETGEGAAGSSTTIALWPKRSKKISPGCIVMTPMRGAAALATVAKSHSSDAIRNFETTSGVRMHADVQGVQAACIGARDAEAEAAEREFLARFRQVAD